MDERAWVYMLRCGDGSLYTGWSTDVQRRLRRHRAGSASRYTASRLPVELVLALPMADRTQARREEARIKALGRAAKLELIAAECASAQALSPAIAGSPSASETSSVGSSSSRSANSDGSLLEPLIRSSGEPSASRRPWRVPK
jgi:putative endonuclease